MSRAAGTIYWGRILLPFDGSPDPVSAALFTCRPGAPESTTWDRSMRCAPDTLAPTKSGGLRIEGPMG